MKGLRVAYGRSTAQLHNDARDSIYEWWWRFLRLSPVLWYAKEAGLQPTDPLVKQVTSQGGNLFRGSFDEWWSKNCVRLFAEPNGRNELRPLSRQDVRMGNFSDDSLLIEVPLSIPVNRIMKSFKAILAYTHDGRHMDLASTSKALWRLKTMRFRKHVIEQQYWATLYKSLHPNLSAVKIGDRLQLAPHLKVRGTSWMENELRYNRLNSIAGRYIYKGKFTLLNAERGSYPNSFAVRLPDNYMPFGRRHHRDYMVATAIDPETMSPWHQWLSKNLEAELKSYVFSANQYYFSDATVNSKHSKFTNFYLGKSDLLP